MAFRTLTGVQPTRLKNFVLGVGIFIVYIMMLVYGIQAFKPAPQYNDFCTAGTFDRGPYLAKPDGTIGTNCTFNRALQDQQSQCYAEGGIPIFEYDDNGCAVALRECNMCQQQFEEARIAYDKFVFITAVIVGIITLLIGYGVLSVEPVGSALIAAGLGAFVYGSARNWENLGNIWRFLLLLVALVLLIYITLRLNSQRTTVRETTVAEKRRAYRRK